jgi:hypothetical protein
MKKRKKGILKFLVDWNEVWAIPAAVLVWVVSPNILRWIDPTAGSFDIGYIQKFVLAAVFVLLSSGFSWLGVRMNFKYLFEYGNEGLEGDLDNITRWQRVLVYLFVPFFYMLCFVLLIAVL